MAQRRLLELRGEVIDAQTRQPLPSRVYLQGEDGTWHFARSASPEGTAVPYDKQARGNQESVERHVTLSAHPFAADLTPGKYTITVERGKEYFPETRHVTLKQKPVSVTIPLRRWIDLTERGWYSGDTHVHRTLEELSNVQLAEDLNVTFPLLYWEANAFASPAANRRAAKPPPKPEPIPIDDTHVIYPLNTEYEIGRVGDKRHTLGAFFVLGHRTVFEEGVPPLKPVAERARREGALLELDKHNWPWSMALVAIMNVDLFELANNHVWRTQFAFKDFMEREAPYMQVERDDKGWTEWGWIDYGLQNYYALVNCGFRLRPTAGCASGVHPAPLGFGRVYVHLEEPFSYHAWMKGLDAGRSFVTTGPMLFASLNGEHPGHTFARPDTAKHRYRVAGTAVSPHPLGRIEVVSQGDVVQRLDPANRQTEAGAYESTFEATLDGDSSTWLAVRCFEERLDGRVRFAHTAPWHLDVPGRPVRPRKAEVAYLIDRVQREIDRSRGVLPTEAVAEYEQALATYKAVATSTR